MKKIIYIMSLLLVSGSLNATSIPPVLNFLPSCVASNQISVEQSDTYDLKDTEIQESYTDERFNEIRQKYILQAFNDTQLKAAKYGSDGIIINKVNALHINRDVKVYGELARPFVRKVNQFRIVVLAEVITFCDDDKSLTQVTSPYNDKGRQVNEMAVQVLLSKKEVNLIDLADKFSAPDSNVNSFSAYSIKIGDDFKQLESLGQESARLILSDGKIAYGYGRNLWFILENKMVVKIIHNTTILNSHGKNQIVYSENYDAKRWVTSEGITLKDTFDKVSENLALESEGDEYFVKGENSRLYFSFDEYMPYDSIESEKKVNGFSVTHRDYLGLQHTVKYEEFSLEKIRKILTYENRKINTDFANRIYLNKKGVWDIVSPNIMLNTKDSVVQRVKITEAVSGDQSERQFLELLEKLNIPTSKKDFLFRYPDSHDEFDIVNLSNEHYTLKAAFESHEPEAQLVEMTVSFFD